MNISPEEYVYFVFRDQFKFNIQKIAETNESRPDFYLEKDGDEYLLEVKAKVPNKELTQKRNDAFNSGRVFGEAYALIRQASITKNISEAKKQLSTLNSEKSHFRLICFVGTGHNAESRLLQIEANIYGRTTVSDWSNTDGQLMPCYYFSHSDFHRYRNNIDGAVLVNSNRENGKLCINDLSPQYRSFRESSMVRAFGSAVIDPPLLEQNKDIWVVDSKIDRNDKKAVLQYLRDKYSLGDLVQDITMKYISGQSALK